MRKLLLIIAFLAPAALWGQDPSCRFAVTFTSATRLPVGPPAGFPAQSTATGQPCISWRITYQASNMSAISLAFQGSPDNGAGAPTGSWTTLGGSCPASNPCTINVGTNPMTDANESNLQVTGYYPWVSLNMTTFTGTGSVLVKGYGYTGTTASGSGSGGGGGGSTAWSALTNPTGNLALTMQAFTSTWTFNATTGAGANLFTLTDTLNNTGTGDLLRLTTKSGSAAIPFQADANGVGARVSASGNLVNVGASVLDYSGGNFKMPAGAGFTATATNNLGFDSTNNNVHIWDSADGIVAPFASAPTTGHCVQAAVSGGSVTLSDSGSTNCGGGGGVSWSAITNPSGNLALTMAANTSTFTFNATTGAGADLFKWTDTANNTGTGALGHFTTASGSAALPIEADSNGKGFEVNSSGNIVNVGASNLDWSAGNQLRVPVAAAATAAANGAIAYDTTAGITHVRTNGADSDVLATTSTDTTTTHAVFASATAGLYISRAIVAADLPNAGVFTTDLSGTFPAGTVIRVNGAAIPTSAKLTSTNASNQIVAAAAETAPITVSATGGIACGTCATTTNGGALSATSPVSISAAGLIACATCATTTNGGALSGTAPITLSAAGAVGINFTANLQNTAGSLDTIQGIQTTSTPQFLRLGLNQAADGTASLAATQTALGNTSTDGYILQNTTAATGSAANQQQWSPRLRLLGNGWKTAATAGSQSSGFVIENQPTDDATNPVSNLVFTPYVNGSLAGAAVSFCYTTSGTVATHNNLYIIGLDGGTSTRNCSINDNTFLTGFGNLGQTGGQVSFFSSSFGNGSSPVLNLTGNGILLGSARFMAWTSTTNPGNSTTGDTGICRGAAGQLNINDGSATCTNYRDLGIRSVIAGGSVPGISGCTAGTQTGGNTAGTYSSGTTGTCTVVLTFSKTAPTGWVCTANDLTTVADTQKQSASTTTTATITGTTVSGDVINFSCTAF